MTCRIKPTWALRHRRGGTVGYVLAPQHLWASSTTGLPVVLLASTVRAPVAFGTTVLFLLFS